MRKIVMFILAGMMILSLVGCGSNRNSTEVDQTTEAVSGASEKPEEVAEVSAETKEKAEAAEGEERIIASSVAVVEILDALSVPMVGVPTSSYDLPESVKDAARIGNPMSPDMEVISSLEPTVVVSVDTLSEDLKIQFENLGISSEFLSLSSYDGLLSSIESIGQRFRVEEAAGTLIEKIVEQEKVALAAIEGKESPSVLIIFGVSGSFMVATENTYVGDLVKRAGGANIMAGTQGSFIPVDMEFLADKNPEFILFMAHANPVESLAAFEKEFETNKAWQNFDAVKNGNTIALVTGYFGMSANLLAGEAMVKMTEILYGE